MNLALIIAANAYALWVLFLAVMCLQNARDLGKLTKVGLYCGYTVLCIGWLLDFFVQVTLGILIFAELPRELTVSQRVKRLIKTGTGWRKRLAEWMRDHLLSPFDSTGRHG